MNKKPLLVIIAGPTAAGKTAFAIRLAQALQTEIISFDSRQFYRELSIGTAKPSSSELEYARHHFVNSHSVSEDFNVALFENAALIKIKELSALYPVVIAVGGSGLYLKALLEGLDKFPDIDQNIKLKLENLFTENGLPPLHDLLLKYDPTYYSTVDLNNPRRIIRALEVCLSAGLPYSSFIGQPLADRDFATLKFCLSPDRPELYTRIKSQSKIHLIPPVSFLDMIALEKNAVLVMTDSGGVQKEAFYFEKPCVIMRSETEWVEIVEHGAGIICDADTDRIMAAVFHFMDDAKPAYPKVFGDGKAAWFICGQLLKNKIALKGK